MFSDPRGLGPSRGRAQKKTLKTEGWEGSTGERRGAEGEDHTDTMTHRDVCALTDLQPHPLTPSYT